MTEIVTYEHVHKDVIALSSVVPTSVEESIDALVKEKEELFRIANKFNYSLHHKDK